MLRMASALEYFAKVLARRVCQAKLSDLSVSECFLTMQ